MNLETRRDLVESLIDAHEPVMGQHLLPTIKKMQEDVLNAQLQFLVEMHVIPELGKEPKRKGRKKDKWTNANENHLLQLR